MIDNSLAINAFNKTQTDTITQAKNDKLLREQTDAFEAFLVKEILDISLKEDESAKLLPKTAGADIYKSMYNDTMSKALSGGLGFSELLYNFLKERG
ncbi:rod-binding protein [Campylobacter gastrosuis]|uniref:Rod-binding protein n=1 Tax=Campylobacter gastrosuis TaxID=2974576 RepID=A0ABT7HP09_9BACT|nr:rod-binding protein [Campylobacter gastrosuis]MDL0088368.1 rod-binding protein [Campylobacter gastrosuis]